MHKKDIFTLTYERKFKIWEEIYNFLIENETKLKNLKENHNQQQFFNYLKNLIFTYLKNETTLLNDLRKSEVNVIPREIIYIYLLKCKKPPHKSEIIRLAGANKGQDEFTRINKMIDFLNLSEPNHYYQIGKNLSEELLNLLENKKNEILTGEFIPDTKNIIAIKKEFEILSDLTIIVSNWLRNNTKFKSLKDLKCFFVPSYKLRYLLELRKDEILSGKFFPTIINLRKIDKDFDNIYDPHSIVNNWLTKASKNRFSRMRDLIQYYVPEPSLLGYSEKKLRHEGYTLKFESNQYRIIKAFFQTVKILDEKSLIHLTPIDIVSWRAFFNYIKEKRNYYFVDLLTGEIFTSVDYSNAKISFHHIDGDKKNDNDDNLCFLRRGNHAMITGAERYNKKLRVFFIKLLKFNINNIKCEKIPLSWQINWRNIALDSNIYIPDKYYRREVSKSNLIINQKGDKRNDLDYFL